MSDHLNRRQFVVLTTAAAAALCLLPAEDAAGADGSSIDIGLPEEYAPDSISDRFLKSNKVLVVRTGDRIHAASGRCTHRNCTVKLRDGKIKCPCHGSAFSSDGAPTSGPARAPLLRFAITLNDQGHLIVDTSRQFGQKQWDDPDASVTINNKT